VDRQWNLSIDGRKSNSDLWNSINWKKVKQIVNRLQTRIVKAVKEYCRVLYGALSMLEPYDGKLSRTVLRLGIQFGEVEIGISCAQRIVAFQKSGGLTFL